MKTRKHRADLIVAGACGVALCLSTWAYLASLPPAHFHLMLLDFAITLALGGVYDPSPELDRIPKSIWVWCLIQIGLREALGELPVESFTLLQHLLATLISVVNAFLINRILERSFTR